METEEENRSAGATHYYVFTFLFWVLVVVSQLHFCLVALVGFLLSRGIVSQVIRGALFVGGEVAISLSGLSW